MIALGFGRDEKTKTIASYCAEHGCSKLVVIAKDGIDTPVDFAGEVKRVPFHDSDKYKWFYPLLQWIDSRTLIVLDECLRLQNRYDIKYNCFRHYLQQTTHQLIFQYLPIIDTIEDFMVLFDLDTRSRWKRERFRPELLDEVDLRVNSIDVRFHRVHVPSNGDLLAAYDREKKRLFDTIGLKDPHTIPRNLYLIPGKAKLSCVDPFRHYLGRNNRFKFDRLQRYKEKQYPSVPYAVFEFCHNFIDFSDVVTLSGQSDFDVLTTNLRVDAWYLSRFQQWTQRIQDAYAAIHR